jgi:hypothetical protein
MRTVFLDHKGKKFYECEIKAPLKYRDNIFYDKYQLEVFNVRHDVVISDNGEVDEYDLVWTDYNPQEEV